MLEKRSKTYRVTIAVFCFLSCALGIFSLIYDVVLPGFLFGEAISVTEAASSLVLIVLPVVLFAVSSEVYEGKMTMDDTMEIHVRLLEEGTPTMRPRQERQGRPAAAHSLLCPLKN